MEPPLFKEHVLLLGSDLGNRVLNLQTAVDMLSTRYGTIRQYSRIYESAAWGFESPTRFLNQAVLVISELSPPAAIQIIKEIETSMGRIQMDGFGYTSRIIDIDIMFIDDLTIRNDQLTVPHPKISERRFALLPIKELNPNRIHPVHKMSVSELLTLCSDFGTVWPYTQV